MADTDVRVCHECGASVYPEHIESNKAGIWSGNLYCIQCYSEHKSSQVTIDPNDFGGAPRPPQVPISQPITEANSGNAMIEAEIIDESEGGFDDDVAPKPADVSEEQSIQFDSIASPKIQHFSGTSGSQSQHSDDHKYKRHLNRDNKGALRIRIFHAKLNDGALKFMEDQINDWVDSNPDIEIKHATTQVGVVEGKSSEPHLIVTLFY